MNTVLWVLLGYETVLLRATLVRQMITDRSAILAFNSYFRQILSFQRATVWGNLPSTLVGETKVFSVSLMSLFICFKLCLVLSVRQKNILSKTKLSSHAFYRGWLKVDVWKTRKWKSGIQNRNGNATGTGKRLEINDNIPLGDKT